MQTGLAITSAVERLEDAVARWLADADMSALDQAVAEVEAALADLVGPSPDREQFTRDDDVAWFALRYRAAARAAAVIATLAQTALSTRDAALAEMATATAIPPVIPRYGSRFVEAMIAQGAQQADLNPPTKARARAALVAVRAHAPASDAPAIPQVYPDPPVRSWAELPREFAGFRLMDLGRDDDWKSAEPLPPFTDIAAFTPDRVPPADEETQFATFRKWNDILEDWAKREGVELAPMALRGWLVLLGHRLPPSEDAVMKRFEHAVLQSPWKEGGKVTVVWIGP